MPLKTASDIALEMKQLREQKRQIIQAKHLALGEEINRAIKSGKLDRKTVFDVLRVTVKSKKSRALIDLDELDATTGDQPREPDTITSDKHPQSAENEASHTEPGSPGKFPFRR